MASKSPIEGGMNRIGSSSSCVQIVGTGKAIVHFELSPLAERLIPIFAVNN